MAFPAAMGVKLRLTLIATALAWSLIGLPRTAAQADTDGVLPVCGTDYTITEWFQANPLSEITGYQPYMDPNFVGPGLKHECASQNYVTSVNGDPTGFARATTATIFPDTIDAAGGDGQRVTVDLGDVTSAGWGGCFPGSTIVPGFCPSASLQGFATNGGTMLFRLRQPDGMFRGLWSLSRGEGDNPGFRLEHVGTPCGPTATSCTFDVVFQRDLTNLPVVREDAQVLLQILISTPVAGPPIVVPMLIKQAGGPLNACVVPTVKNLTFAKAKRALRKHGCTLGKVRQVYNGHIPAGRVVKSSPPPLTELAVGAKVKLKTSLGPRPHM